MPDTRQSAVRRDDFITTTPAWFDAWLRHFGGPSSGVWSPSADSLVRVPYVLDDATIGPVGVRMARGAANSHTARYDVLGDGLSTTMLDQMMESLGVDMLRFDYVSEDAALFALAGSPRIALDACEEAPYIDCAGSWDDYWLARGSSRKSWANRENKLLKQGARFRLLAGWPEVEPQLLDLLRIEASGWKGLQGSGIVQSEATLGFYAEMVRHWADTGALRLFVLDLDGRPVAFELNVVYRDRLNVFKHGYEDAQAKLGVGTVLRMHVLRWAFAQPQIKVVDLFGPASEAKMKWATGTTVLLTVRAFRASAKGILAQLRFDVGPRLKARFARPAAASVATVVD